MVMENPWIHEWSWANLWSMFTDAHRANWQPLVLLSHSFDIWLFGYDPAPHNVMNVTMHLINGGLVYWLTIELLRRTGKFEASTIPWAAFFTALIFLLHPQHVESVAWVVERKDVLYSIFTLACLLAYCKTDQNQLSHHTLPFILFVMSILAKPMAVTIPAILVLLDIYPLKQVNKPTDVVWSCLRKLHYWVVSLAVILVTLNTQSMAMPDAEGLPLWVRTINAIDNSVFYIGHYLWPVNLSPFYPYPEDISYLMSPGFWLTGVAFLTITLTLSLFLLTKNIRWPVVLLGFYLITLLPVSGLIHVGPAKATDHYVYLATLPLSLLTALLFVWSITKFTRFRFVTSFMAALYLVFLIAICIPQVSVWQNHLTLWGRVLTLYPDSAFAHRNMAAAYVEIQQWDKALFHAERSEAFGSPDQAYLNQLRAYLKANENR